MRVIAGSAKGTPLKVEEGVSARPYLEKTRGAIFNSLCAVIEGARVLDLYAGSGSVGIEALSRGAQSCDFVEMERKSVRAIKSNLEKAKLSEYANIYEGRVEGYLSSSYKEFDIIFVDPPFIDMPDWNGSEKVSDIMAGISGLLAENGRIIFRFEHRRLDPPAWDGVVLHKDRRQGRSRVLEYRKQ